MPFDTQPFDDDNLDSPEYLWSEEPVDTYRGYHVFDLIRGDGSVVGFGVVKDEPDVIEQAPLGETPYETIEDARKAIDDAVEMSELLNKQ